KEADWRACADPEPMVRSLPADRYQRELRLFAAAWVRRIWPLLPDACRVAVEASERFAAGRIGEAELAAAVSGGAAAAEAASPGHTAPDAQAYPASAAVDASSVWPRTASNVLAATSCAASAAGCAGGEAEAVEAQYDAAFESARRAELAVQAGLLREFVR